MKKILTVLPLALTLTAGCATVRSFLAANPEAVVIGTIYHERQQGVRCAAANQGGQPIDQAAVARLAYDRLGADATLLRDLGEGFLRNVNIARAMTDQLCGNPLRAPLPELPTVAPIPPAPVD